MSSQWLIVTLKKFVLFFHVVNKMGKDKIDSKIIKNKKKKNKEMSLCYRLSLDFNM